MNKGQHFRKTRGLSKGPYLEPIINPDGSFFCCACLGEKPENTQSPDPRYCLGCFEYLSFEATLLNSVKARPFWVPRPAIKSILKPSNQNLGEKTPTPYPTKGVGSEKPKQLTLQGVL